MNHHQHRSKLWLALALALVVLATVLTGTTAAALTHSSPPRRSAVQVIRVSTKGFDWGDAAIGAAAGVGISMLAVGASLLITSTLRAGTSPARPTTKEHQ